MTDQEPTACQHCGALVFPDTQRCPQCGKFPVKLRLCPKCKSVAGGEDDVCRQCGRVFEPGNDYL